MNAEQRAATIQGLIDLATFLETHPDLPIWAVDAHPHLTGTDDEKRAELDEIAAILGQPVKDLLGNGTQWTTERDFGGRVTYSAWVTPAAEQARYEAHMATYHEAKRSTS